MAFRVFLWTPSPEQVRFICSGEHRNNRGAPGDLVVIPEPQASVLAEDLGKALSEVKGRKLSPYLKRAGVKDVAELAALPHAELQKAKPAPKPSED